MESEKNQNQVFTLFPPPLEIAQRSDFHIPTAVDGDAAASLFNPEQEHRTLQGPSIPADPATQTVERCRSALSGLTHTKQRGGGLVLRCLPWVESPVKNSPARGESASLAPKSAVEMTGGRKRGKPKPGFHSLPTALGNRPKARFPHSHRRDGDAAASLFNPEQEHRTL